MGGDRQLGRGEGDVICVISVPRLYRNSHKLLWYTHIPNSLDRKV